MLILSRVVMIGGLFFVVSMCRVCWKKLANNLGGCYSNLGERSGLQSWVMAIGKEKNLGEKVFHEVVFWCKIDVERAVKGFLLFTFLMFEITTLLHIMFEII